MHENDMKSIEIAWFSYVFMLSRPFQEMYRKLCCSSDRASIVRWWKTEDTDPALIPGGFAEACFASSAERRVEYSYLKGRKGFIRICLEEGKDIVPAYTFRLNWMYRTPRSLRGLRARLSQRIFVAWCLVRWGLGGRRWA